MCTKPLLIKKSNFKYLVYSRRVVVPCGECDECLHKKANDLYVRARMEYERCLKNGGVGFMCCLTYSDDLLPLLDINGTKHMVFNKQHVIDFIKRLRTNLDRKYMSLFNLTAPKFKYLITSEYGTDPTRSHRPHYHLLFFFEQNVSVSVFRQSFIESTYCRLKGVEKRYFGQILQCDIIDPKKGGIQYSSKYVCKDIMYKFQSDHIRKQIKFNKDLVNSMFGIRLCDSVEDEFFNRCIRSRKDYKSAVEKYIRPWRHMLQFFMLSNDLGVSYMVDKYGKNFESMPIINFDGFPYSIPTIVKQKFEIKYGANSLSLLAHSAFINHVHTMLETFQTDNTISVEESKDIYLFARTYIRPIRGHLRIILPASFDALDLEPFHDWEQICNEFDFFDSSDFFVMRDRLEQLMRRYNSQYNLEFRARRAMNKTIKEKQDYERKKYNKNF